MQRPEKNLTASSFLSPLTANETRRLLAYLLRATVRRVREDRIGEHRFRGLAGELAGALVPLVVGASSPLGFYRGLCERFAVDATGSDTEWGPIEAWLPEGRIRWDRALAVMSLATMRRVIEESPEFLATFAKEWGDEGEDAEFALFPEPRSNDQLFVPTLPTQLIAPSCYRSVWTLTRDFHHGADVKSGNVSLFRRHETQDALTGKRHQVPFVSGNAIRGQWRDLAMGRWLQLLGLKASDIPPIRAHSLLAGGSIDQGADGSPVNNVVRREARDKCPPWDLLGGNTDQQIMSGRLRVGDAVLVCRENAWLVRDVVAPGKELREFAESLPEACVMTQIRQGTRMKHADLEQSDGVQMLFHQEVLVPGCQMVHTLHVFGLDGIDQVTLSCLSDLLNAFRDLGATGASTARGFGSIVFDGYKPGSSAVQLPPPDLYLETMEKRRDEMIAWVMSAPLAKAPKPSAGGGRKRSKSTESEAAL